MTLPLTPRSLEFAHVWRDYRPHAASWMNSVMVHALVLTALILPFTGKRLPQSSTLNRPASSWERVSIYLPRLAGNALRTGGGGGGGQRSPTPASRGPIPRFSETPLAPPSATIPNLKPVMPVQPNLLGPSKMALPEMSMLGPWGDPHGVIGPYSNGPGTDGGIGEGSDGGVGPGKGRGYGPGPDAGCCGGPYGVGSGVSAPIPLYRPEPAYSETARKAKYQGIVDLWIVVDARGNVSHVRIAKPLGMGLDEKAVETVRTWRFKPGYRNGAPVPVRLMVEIMFRLF
ncbi:MAG TPA: energy transducer TonB [Terriglobia bacterium]|nr:energy transducer TonB [Terriglobia bacterium]